MDETDIFRAVRRGKRDVYEANISHFDINIRAEDGQSLLHKAVANAQTEIALDLLERSIDVNIADKNGQTALHYIGFYPNVDLARRILESGGKLEIKDSHGNTALWYAVFNARGKYELVALFIKHGADPSSKNNSGRSPYDFALQIKDEHLKKLLGGQ